MDNFMRQLWMTLLIFLLTLLAFGCSSSPKSAQISTTEPVSTATASATAVPPTLTSSPVFPTKSATALPPTPTGTIIPTRTETPTNIPPSPTPTENPPVATLYSSTVCRYGPGTAFSVHTSFREDGFAYVSGRLDDDSWYLIELPKSGETCWIFNEIIEIDKTAALMPVLTPPPKPTPAPVPPQNEEEKKLGAKYFLIIPDNGGPFACGDGMAFFYSGKKGKGIEDDITVALNALFSVKTEYVGNYYNPVYNSSLKVKGVDVENGHATIWLGGKFVKPKSVCEAKRIHLQVWETARQFSEIKHRPIIYVNNALLGDLLEAVQK